MSFWRGSEFDRIFQQNSEVDSTQKTNDSKMNTSGHSAGSGGNATERKISVEEKRSVTNSNKANSLSGSQLLNESGKSTSSAEQQQNSSIGELREEDETQENGDDDGGRCSLM